MRLVPVFLALVALFVIGIRTVELRARSTRLGYELSKIEKSIERLRDRERLCSLRVDELRSPGRILLAARRMSLSPPLHGDVRIERVGVAWRGSEGAERPW
jgi:cell division protein FtsL